VRVIDPATMRRSVRGKGTNTRYVCDILPHDDPTAAHLLVVEVMTPASHSSSYPPHKHDVEQPPCETLLEETYYHRLNPPQGFAFQRVYTDDRSIDEACAVENHDVVMVPKGYHPVVAPHGYDSYYLNVMAGPNRFWVFKNDPAHEWMLAPCLPVPDPFPSKRIPCPRLPPSPTTSKARSPLAPAGRAQDVFNPATGQVTRLGGACQRGRGQRRGCFSASGISRLGQTHRLSAARASCSTSCSCSTSTKDALARMITAEHGKVFTDAQGEVSAASTSSNSPAAFAQLLKGDFTDQVSTGIDNWTLRQPLGVVAGITPFNFPVMVPMWMFPVAIACGQHLRARSPARSTRAPASALPTCSKQAGLPDGVFNVVQGDKEAVDALLEHPDVKAISFVGSTPIANYIYETGARHGKRVQALGGAKNHMVVMPDADMDQAVDAPDRRGLRLGRRALHGHQRGGAGGRCGDTVDPQIAGAHQDALQVLDGTNLAAEMGPIVTQAAHMRTIAGYIEHGVKEGATLLHDGRTFSGKAAGAGCDAGFWMGGTLFDHVTPEMRIYKEEIFGPVLSCVHVKDLAEAVSLINDA